MRLLDNSEALQCMSVFKKVETLKHHKSPGKTWNIAKLLGHSPAVIGKACPSASCHSYCEWNEAIKHTGFLEWAVEVQGCSPFQNVAAVSVLSLPRLNAKVERVLSEMSVVKRKLFFQTLNSILYIWYGLKLSGETYYEHRLPDNVLHLFGTSAAFSFRSAPSVAELAIESLDQTDDDPLFLHNLCVWRGVWKTNK